MQPRTEGVWLAIGAYLLWGLLPVYWKALDALPALEILAHRMVWSAVFLGVVMTVRRAWPEFRRAWSEPGVTTHCGLAALLLAANWGTYIWGVNAERIVETSLGYYINPLVSVFLGVLVLRERLRGVQWFAVGLAGVGVVYLTCQYGRVPWVALVLAVTFAFYGLVKKPGCFLNKGLDKLCL